MSSTEEEFRRLNTAWNELIKAFADSLGIYKLLNWMIGGK